MAAVDSVLGALRKLSKPVTTPEEIAQVRGHMCLPYLCVLVTAFLAKIKSQAFVLLELWYFTSFCLPNYEKSIPVKHVIIFNIHRLPQSQPMAIER